MNTDYFETHFLAERAVADWPPAFVIITACATTGETWSDAENRAADERLTAALRARGVWMERLTGYSPHTAHAEPGWAAALSFDEGCDLGREFRQDAIYYVTGDALFVSYCDARRKPEPAGRFRERLTNSKKTGCTGNKTPF